MFGITIEAAAAICGGSIKNSSFLCKEEIKRIIIDSRSAQQGDLFVAYKGEKTDGHEYIISAFEKGALCALAEYAPEGAEGPVIVVENVQAALEKIIAFFRSNVECPVIGITGSVGKTTAKEMVSSVLSEHFSVHKTSGNLNNTIGVPISLSGIGSETEAAVIEMGINHFGEMSHLGKMVRPDIMLYTMIGHAHLEFLGDLGGVLKAKTEVLPYMKQDGLVIINGDDATLKKLSCSQRIMTFGTEPHCDVQAFDIKTENSGMLSFNIAYQNRTIRVSSAFFGRHMIYAVLEGAAVGFSLGLSDEEIRNGIASYKTVGRRFNVSDTGYIRLIDDCYNANPDSMKSSITSLSDLPGRHICVLGDMRELGENSAEMHYEIGEHAKKCGVDAVLCCGSYADDVKHGAGEIAVSFETKERLMEELPHYIRKGDAVLVKASLGSHLECISEKLKNIGKPFVFLDIDDTLLDFLAAERVSLRKTLEYYGCRSDDEVLNTYSKINISFWERLEKGELTREEVLTGRFIELIRRFQLDASAENVGNLYEKNLKIGHYFMPGAEELLEKLEKKYRLFLVSNGSLAVQRSRLSSAGIEHYFEEIFISEQVGFEKPSSQFFESCFEKIDGFQKENAIIVGDSLSSDILGGKNAGIRTVWYNFRNRPARESIVPDFTVAELSEIPELLNQIFA